MGTFEIDLHGRTWLEAKEEFIAFYNHVLEETGDTIGAQLSVIHGYGSTGEGGLLRKRLRGFLQRFADHLEFVPGEDLDGNPGHTVVAPLQQLPDKDGLLADEIWSYCERPRSRSKVIGRFRRNGAPKVIRAVRSLEKQGRLRRLSGRGQPLYEATRGHPGYPESESLPMAGP